ncbi:protein LEAD-SENSITIVE 1-like [Miscanthus floridulus]|uniref:protein LEAD-SENSITIVE 1-like n=1 Tax=Miscanthus floridulus TaxID=154761 RepID=UPI0034584B39
MPRRGGERRVARAGGVVRCYAVTEETEAATDRMRKGARSTINVSRGIYESDDKVIHFTIDSAQSAASDFTSFSASSSSFQFCSKCREAMREGGVVACCLNCFLEGNNLCLFAYSVPAWFCSMSNIGVQDTCSMEPEDTPETVLRRANDLLAHGFGTYDLALNNCFDFAFYCAVLGF